MRRWTESMKYDVNVHMARIRMCGFGAAAQFPLSNPCCLSLNTILDPLTIGQHTFTWDRELSLQSGQHLEVYRMGLDEYALLRLEVPWLSSIVH